MTPARASLRRRAVMTPAQPPAECPSVVCRYGKPGRAGAAPPHPLMVVPTDTVTGPRSRSRPANHLDQATAANPPGQQTAKAISASTADAESE